ncbi:MAG: Fic family protein [Lewinellaceae bacterium]|nr:Fic family protein [Lewinellaceae bacterium]
MKKPPYELTGPILKLIAAISEKLGAAKASFLDKPSPQLRKQNKIKTIHSSLRIEGNTLSEEQITAIVEHKRVVGPRKDVLEVLNAIKIYEDLSQFNPLSKQSFLSAHRILMDGLIEKPGQFRTANVGIMHGSKVAHLAPPAGNVDYLMSGLFKYLKQTDELALVKSCVFHYEMEFIHPFLDGNGRMGRLWQTLILMQEYPIFEYLPFETMISQTQEEYYDSLAKSDKAGHSTVFIEYMLKVIDRSLENLLESSNRALTTDGRLEYFLSERDSPFSRKDYLQAFKQLSTATASRDLREGVRLGLLEKSGDKRNTIYKKKG